MRRPVPTRILVAFARERGIPPERTLHGTGLTAPDLDDPGTALTVEQELLAVRNLLRHAGDVPGLGAAVGARFSAAQHGDLGFALMTSATGRDAFDLAVRYADAADALVALEIGRDAGDVVVGFEAAGLPAPLRSFLLERDVTATAAMLTTLFAPVRARIEVALAAPRVAALAEACAPHAVVPGPRTRIVLPAATLDMPLPSADVTVARALEGRLRERARQAASGGPFAVRVHHALLDELPRRAGAARVADRLHVAPRTLRRRLEAEGTSFQAVADAAYREEAERLLAAGTSVGTTAARLGYAETASFTRAFRRWTGSAPSAHRGARR